LYHCNKITDKGVNYLQSKGVIVKM
jgi:hypothetical protein